MNDQELRGSVELHLLQSVLVVLASTAVPLIIASQCFLLTEPTYAIIDGDITFLVELTASSTSQINSLELKILERLQVSWSIRIKLDYELEIAIILHHCHYLTQSSLILEVKGAICTLVRSFAQIALSLAVI